MPQGAALRAGRPEHADDRRRRRAPTTATILGTQRNLYGGYDLRASITRPSARSPTPARCCRCSAPPLMREHRLYQADWLMRFYGFAREEIADRRDGRHARPRDRSRSSPGRCDIRDGSRSTSTAPPREMLLRVPGLGRKAVDRIIAARRWRRLRLEDVGALCRRRRKDAAVHHRRAIGARRALPTRSTYADARRRPAEQLELFALRLRASRLAARDGFRRLARRGARPAARPCAARAGRRGRSATPAMTCSPGNRDAADARRRRTRSRCRAPFIDLARDRDPAPRPRALRVALPPALAAARSAEAAGDASRSGRPPRRSDWPRRCAATSTRCAPSCASARSRSPTAPPLRRLVRARPSHRRAPTPSSSCAASPACAGRS